MKISKDKYDKVIIALDSIRCDNREGKTTQNLRQMDDDVMQHIERKGYCNYILGEGNIFVRTLTTKGYDVLASETYKKYLWKQTKDNLKNWIPIWVSILMIILTGFNIYITNNRAAKQSVIEGRLDRLGTEVTRLNHQAQQQNEMHQTTSTKIATIDSVLRTLTKTKQ